MNLFWLLRMSRWVRRPPSEGAVKFVLAIVALCLLLFGVERIWGWPEILTPDSRGGRQPW